MSASPPFVVSPEAEQWLLQISPLPDKQPGFSSSPRFRVSKGAELIEEFEGEHYSFAYASPETWLLDCSAISMLIGDRAFWLTPDILEKLRGKTLTVIQRDVGRGRHAGRIRNILVAV